MSVTHHSISLILPAGSHIRAPTPSGRTEALPWSPLAGSLVEIGAGEYRVGFAPKADRDYLEHGRMGIMLLQRIAPPSALAFLGRDQQALQALSAYLSGEDRDGPISEIVSRADQASTRHALAHGSRARFGTATARPLIELLMDALKDLLRTGGKLPLNRNGAAGWVYDGSIWFVSKRVADEVRAHLKQHAPDEAVPGEAKNDRLFDTWQEYGAVLTNPMTQQAIWYVMVHGDDGGGYSNRLSMLRFPLAKIWSDPALYPAPMAGHIEVLTARDADGNAPAAESTVTAPAVATKPKTAPAEVPLSVRAPTMGSKMRTAPRKPKAAEPTQIPTPPTEQTAPEEAETMSIDAPMPPQVADSNGADNSAYLAPTDTAKAEARLAAIEEQPASSAPTTARAAVPAGLSPVVLQPRGADAADAAPELAVRFMEWLLAGLRSGTIAFNQTGAPVHFVAQGMGLVSPLIFREFARQQPQHCNANPDEPGRLGMDVQRAITKAGWQVPGPGGKNIHQYAVVKRGGVKKGKLALMLLAHPVRWVKPVPPPNPALAPLDDETADPPVSHPA